MENQIILKPDKLLKEQQSRLLLSSSYLVWVLLDSGLVDLEREPEKAIDNSCFSVRR